MADRATLTVRTVVPTVKRIDGHFVIYRKVPRGFARGVGGSRMPRFRHATFEGAETEASRLSTAHPESTFVILQEVATVKAERCSDV